MAILNPKEIDLDGHIDERGIKYIGVATLQPNGEYHAMAIVNRCLCRVACRIHIHVTPNNAPLPGGS